MIQIDLPDNDRVVAAFTFQDRVVIITECGRVYQMHIAWHDDMPVFELTQT